MLEKMFTTKMSADKKKLQSRFSKIRSKNGKTSRIIAIVLFALIIISIIAVSVYVAVNRLQDDISQNSDINALYELKGTYIGDAPTVRKIVDLTNTTDYNVDGIELRTDAEPYGLDVNFMVDNRKNYRNIDENSLNRMSGLIFSLVKNVDEIRYSFYDAYSDKNNKDDVFYGAYYSRENLCERISNSKITTDYIASSTVDYKTFEEYYDTLLATEVAAMEEIFFYDSTPYEMMIEKLGNWYRVPPIITASFSRFEVGKEPYPTSVTAYFTPAGTEMYEYKKEVGKIKAPFSYRTMAQVLSMQLQFPDDATQGHLQFVFDYKDGTSETSEYYNILVDKQIKYINQTGILVKDAVLYSDAFHKEQNTNVKKNDLVYVFYDENGSYYVQLPVMNIPPTEGYIKSDCISFNDKLFSDANHGVVAKGVPLYNSAASNDTYSVQEFNQVVEIIERKDGFALCGFPAGEKSKWVELKNIQFQLE